MTACHADHMKKCLEPLKIERVIHCGQHREIDAARGINLLTRLYKFHPFVGGFLFVTYHIATGTWAVKESLGNDVGGFPLLSLTDVTAVVSKTTNWQEMETALATYFNASVCEYHANSAVGFRVKVGPRVDAHVS